MIPFQKLSGHDLRSMGPVNAIKWVQLQRYGSTV